MASGLAMGLSGFGVALLLSMLGQDPADETIPYLAYPLGFVVVILGRQQLFTENTLLSIAATLSDRSLLVRTGRLWGIVLGANLVGHHAVRAATTKTPALPTKAVPELATLGADQAGRPFWTVFWTAIVAGWLIALVAWLVTASTDTVGQVLVTCVIGLGKLAHSIAGSAEVLSAPFRSPPARRRLQPAGAGHGRTGSPVLSPAGARAHGDGTGVLHAAGRHGHVPHAVVVGRSDRQHRRLPSIPWRSSVRAARLRSAAAASLVLLAVTACGASDGAGSAPPTAAAARRLPPAAFAAAVAEADRVTVNVHVPDEGRIAGTDLLVPYALVRTDRALPVDRATPLAVYCLTGRMSAEAVAELRALGYTDVVELAGGMLAWQQAGRPLQP